MDALHLATALEKFASHIDESDGARQRDDKALSDTRVEKIAAHYRSLVGTDLDPDTLRKVADMGDAGLALIEKLAAAHSPPRPLGGAASGDSPYAPRAVDPMAEFTAAYSGSAR